MSWQPYIDTNLVGSLRVSEAAIIGFEGKPQVWAKSASLDLSEQEIKSIATAFSNKTAVTESGLKISGKKYFFISLDDAQGSIQVKQGADGACLFMTNKAIILGVYKTPIQQAECNNVVCTLGDYLKLQGY